ncbi:hypothetical protein C7382_105147 [Porphyromonas loveana]|uniref:Uncharacterized protein n=1 Tax=Porphyromonas loveana TaxID=1884669 RepID=A0A2U1FJE4_9PORP|nr:hypothetical protein C7382_105147 [Porphyromonas loveana]
MQIFSPKLHHCTFRTNKHIQKARIKKTLFIGLFIIQMTG